MFFGNPTEIIGEKISHVLRSGKVVTIQFQNNKFLSAHLKLSGQILFATDKHHAVFKNPIPRANTDTMPGKTTYIILTFDDNSVVFFNDMRKFGWMKLGDKPEIAKGVDVLSTDFTENYLAQAISKTARPIKVVLMDQEKMAGIGNIYANDALYLARIHPSRKANSLNSEETNRLYTAILDSIREGLQYRGSSAQDELYVMPDGSKGEYQHHFKAYHQHGKPCVRCKTIMERIEVGGRGTFFCPKCQQ
jgi:formamidopyrimidine-DNA glycosylase